MLTQTLAPQGHQDLTYVHLVGEQPLHNVIYANSALLEIIKEEDRRFTSVNFAAHFPIGFYIFQ